MKLTPIPLVIIEAVAFLLIIGETYCFFAIVVPLGSVPHNFGTFTWYSVLKVILTIGLGVLWFAVMILMTRLYVRSRLGRPTPTPSS